MSTKKTTLKYEAATGLAIGILVCSAIVFGVYIQVGSSTYISNVLLKIIGILAPMILVFLILWSNKSHSHFKFSYLTLSLFILYLTYQVYLALTSLSFGRYFMGTADRNLGGVVSALAILSFILGLCLNMKNQVWVLNVVVLVAVIQTLTVTYQKFIKIGEVNSNGNIVAPAIFGTFYNANPLSYFLGIVASGVFGYMICTKFKSKRFITSAFILFALTLGVNWSASIQGLIGLIVVMILFTAPKIVQLFRRDFGTFLSFSYIITLVGFFIAIILIPLKSGSNISQNSYLERLEIYKIALSMASESLVTGVGVDNFASKYGTYTLSTDSRFVDNAHSIPLHFLSTQGIIGFFFYLTFVLFILRLKPMELSTSGAEWSFWQAIFVASVFIGIIGIEHPVISFLAFLSAGNLMSMSNRHIVLKPQRISHYYQIALKFMSLILLIGISALLFHFSQSEIRTASALNKLSLGKITTDQFVRDVGDQYESVYNARVLLTTGQAFVAVGDRIMASSVAQVMLTRYPDDQRTSVLFFAIADKWDDSAALKVAITLRNELFPNIQ